MGRVGSNQGDIGGRGEKEQVGEGSVRGRHGEMPPLWNHGATCAGETPKGSALTEADRGPIPLGTTAALTLKHKDTCPHKAPRSNANSGTARAVFKRKMESTAATRPRLHLVSGKINNAVQETALGHMFSADASTLPAVKKRVDCGWGAFNALKPALLCDSLELEHKVSIYKGMIISVVLWGCEVWSVRDAIGKAVEFNHKCLASILGRALTKEEYHDPLVDIVHCIIVRQLHYLGHRLRGRPTTPTLRALLTRVARTGSSAFRTRPRHGDPMRYANPAAGQHKPPSTRYVEETSRARSIEYVQANGPNPEDVAFKIDRKSPAYADSMFGLTPFESFDALFDAAQNRGGWEKMITQQAQSISRKSLREQARGEEEGVAPS